MPVVTVAYQSRKAKRYKIDTLDPMYGGDVITYPPTVDGTDTWISSTARRYPVVTPDFAHLVLKRVHLPENSYKLVVNKTSEGFCNGSFVKTTNTTYGKTREYWIGPAPFGVGNAVGEAVIESGQVQAVMDQITNKVLNKIKDQKVNIGQVYAERMQTSRLIADTAIKIAGALRALKQGNVVAAANALGVGATRRMKRRGVSSKRANADFVSQSWLALQYGWKPLLDDVYGAAQAVAEAPLKPYLNFVSSGASLSASKETTFRASDGTLFATNSSRATIAIRYGLWFTIGDTGIKSMASLGITNPALVAWELLPWSFVIDWFLPVGNYVSTWDATNGCDFVGGFIAKKSNSSSLKVDKYTMVNGTGYSGMLERVDSNFTYERSALLTFPSGKLPSFKNPVSYGHVANALALLQQLRK